MLRKFPTSIEFNNKVIQICANLGIPDPNVLMGCMAFETGGSFSSSEKNWKGSQATGLIQFLPSTAISLGTTVDKLSKMTNVEQLTYVEKYLNPYRGKIKTLTDCYMAILWPRAVGKGDDYILFQKGTNRYTRNSGLDIGNKGYITAGDATKKVQQRLELYKF